MGQACTNHLNKWKLYFLLSKHMTQEFVTFFSPLELWPQNRTRRFFLVGEFLALYCKPSHIWASWAGWEELKEKACVSQNTNNVCGDLRGFLCTRMWISPSIFGMKDAVPGFFVPWKSLKADGRLERRISMQWLNTMCLIYNLPLHNIPTKKIFLFPFCRLENWDLKHLSNLTKLHS